MNARTTATAALCVLSLLLAGAVAGCGTATVEKPSFQSESGIPDATDTPGRPGAPATAKAARPGPSHAAIVGRPPLTPAVIERIGFVPAGKPHWRAECGASGCYRIITFEDGAGWSYVAASVRVGEGGGSPQVNVSAPVSRVHARVDKGELFTFRCGAERAACSLSDDAARRLARALRTGRTLVVQVKVDQFQRKRIGVQKEDQVQTYPARSFRRELDLSGFRAPLRSA